MPLDEYIAAAMPSIRLLASIEKSADLVPGSILDANMQGIEGTYGNGDEAAAWAGWIADGFVHEDGSSYTQNERKQLAEKLAPLFA